MYPRKVGSTEHSEDNGEWKKVVEKFGLNHDELCCSASIRESVVAVPSMEKEFGQRF